MAEACVRKVDTGRESEVAGGGGCRLDGYSALLGLSHRWRSIRVRPSFTEKPTSSNSIVTELSRERHLTEIKF
jgi:hypothetical protein